MSAPITEAHLRLANQLVASPPSPLVMATLIADSEARAIASAVTMLTCIHHNDQQRADCPVCVVKKLRAERDWLKTWQDQAETNYVIGEPLAKKLRDTEAECDQLRAEVEQLKFRHQCESDLSVEAFARALRAEAELAAERARLDWLSARGFEHRHHETGDHLGYEWTISSCSELENVTLRDVIDAEMKEDAK